MSFSSYRRIIRREGKIAHSKSSVNEYFRIWLIEIPTREQRLLEVIHLDEVRDYFVHQWFPAVVSCFRCQL
jgi:hypothetical protein